MWIWVIYDASTKHHGWPEFCFNYVLPRNNRIGSICTGQVLSKNKRQHFRTATYKCRERWTRTLKQSLGNKATQTALSGIQQMLYQTGAQAGFISGSRTSQNIRSLPHLQASLAYFLHVRTWTFSLTPSHFFLVHAFLVHATEVNSMVD